MRLITYLIVALPLLGGCQRTVVHTTIVEPILHDGAAIEERELLDVGVCLFDPGTDGLSEKETVLISREVRNAESRFMPVVLMDTLQRTGNWGVVRVIADQQTETDVYVDATIRKSDGAVTTMDVIVSDVSGATWFARSYEAESSKFSYDRTLYRQTDPFQSIYNQISNDMFEYFSAMSSEQRLKLRTITELKFAQRFSPQAFNGHIGRDRDGIYQVERLPAANDPTLQRIHKIRERDRVFTDLLQDYYVLFHRQMQGPYNDWREESYTQVADLRRQQLAANAQIIGGAMALVGGIAAGLAGGGSMATQTAALGAAVVGYPMIQAGLERKAQVQAHITNIQEIATSLNAEIEPHYVELEDRTVRLAGTLDEQSAQWRRILQEIYEAETGLPAESVQ